MDWIHENKASAQGFAVGYLLIILNMNERTDCVHFPSCLFSNKILILVILYNSIVLEGWGAESPDYCPSDTESLLLSINLTRFLLNEWQLYNIQALATVTHLSSHRQFSLINLFSKMSCANYLPTTFRKTFRIC